MKHPNSIDPAHWLSALPDDIPISDINIPGSHNAAAINTQRPTRWACQRHSITEQLQKGIRLLDIRLKPKKRHNTYEFITCHGHLGPFGANEFQPLDEVLEECTSFLKASPKETIIMMIQIDDWRRTPTKAYAQMLESLKTRLSRLPLLLTPSMPTLKDCRGHIFPINRINDDPALGAPINIPNNTLGTTLPPIPTRNYEVYIQDRYKKLNRINPEAHKLRLTIEAQEKRPKGALLLNFASATKPFGRFVYIMEKLSAYLANREADPAANPEANLAATPEASAKPIGWLLLDYPFGAARQATAMQTPFDLPMQIIASNYPPASLPTHDPAT